MGQATVSRNYNLLFVEAFGVGPGKRLGIT